MRPMVARVNDLELAMQALGEEELRNKTQELRRRRAAGESLDDLLVEAFAAARESGRVTEYAAFRRPVDGRLCPA